MPEVKTKTQAQDLCVCGVVSVCVCVGGVGELRVVGSGGGFRTMCFDFWE